MSNIAETLKGINAGSFKSEEDRKAAVVEAHALLSRIESTYDTTFRLTFTYPSQMACIKTALEMGLFTKWLEKNNGGKASPDELAGLVQTDHVLLQRLLRHLAATNVLVVDSQGKYEMTAFSTGLIKEDMASLVQLFWDINMPISIHLPTFLKDIGYQNPTGNDKDCFKHWSSKTVWEYFAANPPVAANLGAVMKSSGPKRGNFTAIYPCGELSCGKDEALVVDIGGSVGHDVQAFKSKHPNASGRLILQDLPDVIENAKKNTDLDASIEKEAYDFFKPQPHKGATVYLLHTVLHDWPDHDAKRIMETVKEAMKKGHSKLLIHEVVVPEVVPDVEATSRDFTMMYMASGVERTEKHWRQLIESAGLKINKIWRNPLFVESVIETEAA